MFERIIVLLAVAFSLGYGGWQRKKGFNRKYFNVALLGMTALFLSRIYYLLIVVSHGDDEVLTIGTLGQASAYLFFMTADLKFLSRAILRKTKERICLPAAFLTLLLGCMFVISAVRYGTVSAYIGEGIYLLSMCPAVYIAANEVSYRRENPAGQATWKFNICVCILALANGVFEISGAALQGNVQTVTIWIVTVISSATIALMLPLLRKGMNVWAQ